MFKFLIKKTTNQKRLKRKNTKKPYTKYYKPAKELVLNIIEELKQDGDKINFAQYNRISIKYQKTRWGSCSSKKNLNFNYKILFLPYDIAKYLVVHELCHLKHLNHSKDYWDLVEYVMPNYKINHNTLKNIDLKRLKKDTFTINEVENT